MPISNEEKQAVKELVDRWFAEDPGDTGFRTFRLMAHCDALRFVCDLLWVRDVVVCQVITAERVNAMSSCYELLVRCRWRAPWSGV